MPTRVLRALVVALLAGLGALVITAGPASASPRFPGIPDCKDAPTAQMPGTGLPGYLDPGPSTPPPPGDPFATHPTTSVYEQYGYAGLSWHTYDLGCGGGLRDTDATVDTAIGNAFLSGAVWLTSAANGLHAKVSHPHTYMAPLDDVVTAVTHRLRDAIWNPWGGAALVGVAALLLWYSTAGRLSTVTSAAAWAVLVLAVVAGLAQYPSRVASFFDSTVTSSIAAVNTTSAGLARLPATSDPARAQGALLTDRICYDAWVRGEFGSAHTAAAERWAPALYRDSAFTWAQAQRATAHPQAGKRLTEQKASRWKETTAQIQDKDPVAYAAVQGKAGGRAGTGLLAFFGALFTALFRLVADVFVFTGLVMLRLLVMFFPAVAVIGVMAPMASVVRRVANMAGASVVNVIAFSVGSSVHTTVVSAILSRAENGDMGVLALVLCLVVTLAAFVLLYPLLSLTTLLGQSGTGHRALRRAGREVGRYYLRRKSVADGTSDALEDRDEAGEDDTSPGAPAAPRRNVRRTNLPPESFGRPAQTHPPVPDEERHLTSGVRPRPQIEASDASQAAPRRRVVVGEVTDHAPLDARRVTTYPPAHDSHTEIRSDGVGPRVYDPDTKRSVLGAPVDKDEAPT